MPTHLRKRHLDSARAEDDTIRPDHGGNYEHEREEDQDDHDDDVEAEESDRSSLSGDGTKKKFIMVNLSEIRKEVQCPICLGIIRKTRTVMECLHRFCRECIDKSMRLGNNECPACRTHCASRRSLRDDKNFDKLISYLYPDIDKYEEEELALNEEDRARNKQIQATIDQTLKRQSKTSCRKRMRSSKRTAAAEMLSKSRLILRDNPQRGRIDNQTDDISDNGERGSSSTNDEHDAETRPRRSKWPGGVLSSQPSATTNADRSSEDNGSDGIKECAETVRGIVCSSEGLAWGKGGTRSHTRHGNGSSANIKNGQKNRIARLVDYLKNRKQIDNEMDVQIMLVSMDEQKVPNLPQPYLSCKSTLTIEWLCQYVGLQSNTQADEIEIYVVKELKSRLIGIDPSKDKLQMVNKEDNLGELRMYNFNHGYVILAYQKKASS